MGIYLTSYGKTLGELERYVDAEAVALEAHGILEAARGPEHEGTLKTISAFVELYESSDTAEPGRGYAEKVAEWRAKLPEDNTP